MMLAADPVISEFMANNDTVIQDGNGNFSDWIELFNPDPVDSIDLTGWYLTDNDQILDKWQFPAQTLGPGEFLTVYASGCSQPGSDCPDSSVELHTNFKLSGGGEYLALVRPDATTIVQQFVSNSGEYPPQFSDISYGLDPNSGGETYFLSPTPGVINSGQTSANPAEGIVISEIMYHPSSENPADEYIELLNNGLSTVDLTGWQISNGVEYTFPAVTISPGDYLVVAANEAVAEANYPAVDSARIIGGWAGQLSDKGETIELINAAGSRADRVSYADQGDWAARAEGPLDFGHRGWIWQASHDGGGDSLELINPAVSNNQGQNWAASQTLGGTPGTANSVAASNIAPMILDTANFPLIPSSSDSVTVTARLRDESSVGLSASVLWRVDGASSFNTAAMFDDGQHADDAPGDGLYGAILPPQADGTIVEFYLQASDAEGNSRSWPAATQPTGQQLANLLYQVDDSFDATAAWVPGSQPVYYLVMTDAERAELADIGDGGTGNEEQSNAQMNGTFISINGQGAQVRYNVGLRNRGHGSRIASPNNVRLNIPHDQPWQGVTKLNINAKYIHSQLIGSAIYRLAGIAASEAAAIQLRTNGQDLATPGGPRMFGSYIAVEPVGAAYAENHFPEDPNGNLYRVLQSDDTPQEGDLRYEGTNPDAYRDTYFKQTNEEQDDWSDLIQLTDVLNNAPEATFLQDVSQVIDIGQWMRYLALDALLLNRETGLNYGIGDDYALYRGRNDSRFVLVPWDLDTLFNQGNSDGAIDQSIFRFDGVEGLRRLLSHPDTVPLYYQAIVDVVKTVYNPQVLNPLIDLAWGDFVDPSNIAETKQFIIDRTAAVLAQIPREFTINSDLPVISGFQRTTTNTASLDGTADSVTTASVLVNGQSVPWSPRAGTWSASGIALNPGINRLVVQAFDGPGGSGKLVNQRFIDLWYETSQDGGGGTTPVSVNISTGSSWSYLDDGSDQGTAWRGLSFNDSSWQVGNSQLGYGDGDEATVVSFGGELANKQTTTYFRKTFNIPAGEAESLTTATIGLLRDDGAAVYLNGVEVIRDNLPGAVGDATPITFSTFASSTVIGSDEDTFFEFSIDPGLLQDGDNVLAVEVHQRRAISSDISFDLKLDATGTSTPPDNSFSLPEGQSWSYLDDGSDQSAAWRGLAFDDGSWQIGNAQLGYGDGDEATVVSFGGDLANKQITTYFRKTFNIPAGQAESFTAATISLLRDDGAAVYLNGVEVIRDNLPGVVGDATPITSSTRASSTIGGSDEDTFFQFSIDPGLLQDGANLLAVEIHQADPASSDISFDLRLSAGQMSETTLGGVLASDTTLTAADGPYRVSSELVVPVGITLTIEPGTTVYFDEDTQVTVYGIIDAQGTEFQRIRLSSVPGAALVPDIRPQLPPGPPRWGGVQLRGTNSDQNIISYVDFENAQSNRGAIGLIDSTGVIDNVSFAGTRLRMVFTNNSSVIIRNSVFPDMFQPGDSPLNMTPPLDNVSEQIKGEGGIPAGGHYVIENNIFGTNKGHNDIIDVNSNQFPNPILEVRNNRFTGGGDEAIDGGGDILIDGNVFTSFAKDLDNNGSGDSNAFSTGDVLPTVLMVTRNTFVGVDHVANFKKAAYGYFENNTIVGITAPHLSLATDPPSRLLDFSAINFLIPNETDPANGPPRDAPGLGAFTAGNIFVDIPQTVFGNVDFVNPNINPPVNQVLEVHDSLVPSADVFAGADGVNGRVFDFLTGDPRFVDAAAGDYRLGPGSPALGTGPNGLDIGAMVPAGASISGEPAALTASTGATLTIGGPGILSFIYRLNDGPWSDEIQILDPRADLSSSQKTRTVQLPLSGLTDGDYTVSVRGRDFAGRLQETPTVSSTWTVDTVLRSLVINEVLAINQSAVDQEGTTPDLIELYNAGASSIDLSGMGISDDPANPSQFVFAAGTTLSAGDYLVLLADNDTTTSGIHLGFSLNGDGSGVFLYDSAAAGGGLLDAVEFGVQVSDVSIGRVGPDGRWTLTRPTFGGENESQPAGDPQAVRINEWFASGDVRLSDDVIELYNPDSLPVSLAGLHLTDDAVTRSAQDVIAPLSFIAGDGFAKFKADGNAAAGPNHLAFKLSAEQGLLGLFEADWQAIDQVLYYDQTTDYSQGRDPDGADSLDFSRLPTPGLANSLSSTTTDNLIAFDDVWKFDESGADLGTGWRDPAFNDSSWPAGAGPLGVESSSLPVPLGTDLTLGQITYYFRRSFQLAGNPADTVLKMRTLIDDGAIVYVNGVEVQRLGMPSGAIDFQTRANRTIGNAGLEGLFAIPTGVLTAGDNLIAVEVHQASSRSSDIVFGLSLDAETTTSGELYAEQLALLDDLRITEIMYNPIGGSDFEFVELQNIGGSTLDLSGIRLRDAVDFTFPATTLASGEYVVIVNDVAAFESRYGSGVNVAGEFSGNLSNGGEGMTLLLPDALDVAILRFDYNDRWFVSTDGGGPSLVVDDATVAASTWSNRDSWRPSLLSGGSPGTADVVRTDLNNDGKVGLIDLAIIQSNLGTGTTASEGDVNDDGTVNRVDVVSLLRQFGKTQASSPSPSSETAAASAAAPSAILAAVRAEVRIESPLLAAKGRRTANLQRPNHDAIERASRSESVRLRQIPKRSKRGHRGRSEARSQQAIQHDLVFEAFGRDRASLSPDIPQRGPRRKQIV